MTQSYSRYELRKNENDAEMLLHSYIELWTMLTPSTPNYDKTSPERNRTLEKEKLFIDPSHYSPIIENDSMFKKVPTIVIDEEPEDDITYPTAKRIKK
jgi:hypothetical protein